MSDAESEDTDANGRTDPYRRHRFAVEVEGLSRLGCAEVGGLTVTVGSQPAASTDTSRTGRWRHWLALLSRVVGRLVRSQPSGTGSPTLKLWRGVTDDLVLWNWFRDWRDGQIGPRNVGVFLLDADGNETVGWRCQAATPVEWSGPDLAAHRSGVAMEKLELAHEGISATTDTTDETFRISGPNSPPER